MKSDFLKSAIWFLLLTSLVIADRPMSPFKVLYSNDLGNIESCDSPFHKRNEPFSLKALQGSIQETIDAGVDVHMLQPMATYVPMWKSKIYSIQEHYEWWTGKYGQEVSSYIKYLIDGGDIAGDFVDYCRSHGISPFISFRLNDWHSLEWIGAKEGTEIPTWISHCLDKFRAEHTETWNTLEDQRTTPWDDHVKFLEEPGIVGKLRNERVLCWRHKAVVDRIYSFIEEVCRNYDIEGIELDFMRHVILYNLDLTTSQQRKQVTGDFIRRIRRLLDETAKPGQYRYLCIRIPAYIAAHDGMGIDIKEMQDIGVDMFNLSNSYYTVQQIETARIAQMCPRVAVYHEMCHTTRVVNKPVKHFGETYTTKMPIAEQIWTTAHIAYSSGARGVSFFNFAYYRQYGDDKERTIRGLVADSQPPFDALKVLGDEYAVAQMPQHYFLAAGWNSYIDTNRGKEPKLQKLCPGSFTAGKSQDLELDMFPPVTGWKTPGLLRMQCLEPFEDAELTVAFNGQGLKYTDNVAEPYENPYPYLLGDETTLKGWLVPIEIIKTGTNIITLTMTQGSKSVEILMIDIAIR
jgi:hypothetical protein